MEKIIIFVNEFFGAWGTARGGYGFLARNLLPKGLGVSPKEMTICLGRSKSLFFPEVKYTEEGFKLIKLPKLRILAAKIVNQYDIVISIEATVDFLFSLKGRLRRKILFWIQDPRPKADWEEINTVQLAKEGCYWNEKTYSLVGECYRLGLIKFASQAKFLRPKAVELYGLPKIAENEMMLLPNPIVEGGGDIENLNKENEIIFVGRLDSVKRGWLFCEIAKNMPQYKFLIMGASTNADEKARNSVLDGYKSLPNLHFLGHLEGDEKARYMKRAKVLVNTSIHEALPVSFLEAFSYGVTVVSNQDPDQLVSKFGVYIGQSYGDGWGDVDKFITAINGVMSNELRRVEVAKKAKEYVDKVHGVENFRIIFNELTK